MQGAAPNELLGGIAYEWTDSTSEREGTWDCADVRLYNRENFEIVKDYIVEESLKKLIGITYTYKIFLRAHNN